MVQNGRYYMALSYNRLWKLIIDKGMNKTDLRIKTGMSQATLAKLSKGENVTTEVLERICKVLNCEIGDIVEISNKQEKDDINENSDK